jgi:serine/threonine-protein kinase
MILGWTLEQQGKFDDAISEITISTRLTDFPQVIAALAHAQAMAGRRNEADRLLQDLVELSKRRYVSPYDVATVYAANSDTENALAFLEKACDGRSGWLPLWMRVDPKLDGIRGQERFSAILKRVGIPDSQPGNQRSDNIAGRSEVESFAKKAKLENFVSASAAR